MRRILLALLITAFAMGIAAAQNVPGIPGINAAPPGPQPKVQIVNPFYDFGSALEGKMVNHVFKIKNAGQGVLVIRGMKTSCGCTAAKPTKNNLEPGEETDISVGFDTHFQKGRQVRTITAYTNDPDTPQAVMTMQGDVKQQVAATPAQVAFGTVRKGTDATQEVTIDDLTDQKGFKVGPVSNSNPAIKVTQEPRKDGKPGATLKVELLPSMEPGTFDDSVKVITNRVPVQIDVFGTVTGDLSLDPAQVSFGIVPKGQDVVRIMKLTNAGPKDVKVLDISSSAPSVFASAEAVKPGREYKIMVTLRRGTPDGQLRGQLAIKTDDPEQSTIEVPFYAIVGQFKI
ncbi:MAG: DUF1573 domain-containing protein [Candidatus Binataceae bacterium]